VGLRALAPRTGDSVALTAAFAARTAGGGCAQICARVVSTWARSCLSGTNALTSLLREIGGAVLLTHSQSSVFGFQLCDREPSLVEAHITVEPNGPPFYDVAHVGPPTGIRPCQKRAGPGD
jgi:hypothetical protein